MAAEPGVSVYRFLWGYFRVYVAWGVIAFAASAVTAVGTVTIASLIDPIFSEVLLSDQGFGSFGGALGGGDRGEGEGGAGPVTEPAAEMGTGADAGATEKASRLRRRVDLTHHLGSSYQSLKRRWGIGDEDVVWFTPLLFVLVFLVRALGMFVNGYAFQKIGLGATTDVRNALYERILEQSSRFYADHPSGELVSRVVNDIGVMQGSISNRLIDIFQQPLSLVLLVWMLFSIHFQLALVCLVVAPVILIPIVRFGKGMRHTSHRSQERMADLANLVAEGVRGHRVVKAFNMEGFELKRFVLASSRHLRVNLRAQLLSHSSSPVVESLAAMLGAFLLMYAGKTIRAGELSPSDFVTFLTAMMLLYDPIRKLNKVNLVFQQAIAAAHRVQAVMGIPLDVAEVGHPEKLNRVETGIHYEGVSFAYETEPVLSEIELEVAAGEIVALVGPSGAGKSSLVNLLPRYFDPDRGRILVDGHDVRSLSLASLRALIGIVTQETVLFNDTVRNNIAYGRADLPRDDVERAAQAAYASDFIEQLPDGYDTVIGESGLKLSGGQRQRLAIARALLKNAPILILDEATSALDSESEALVQKALGNLMKERTTLVIAHRLSTVVNADRIVVMEGGRIVQQGSHQELLAAGGTYKRLYDLQFDV